MNSYVLATVLCDWSVRQWHNLGATIPLPDRRNCLSKASFAAVAQGALERQNIAPERKRLILIAGSLKY
ncbi:MAG: hypothetical protein AB1325_00580 [Nitrospirota bacterium]